MHKRNVILIFTCSYQLPICRPHGNYAVRSWSISSDNNYDSDDAARLRPFQNSQPEFIYSFKQTMIKTASADLFARRTGIQAYLPSPKKCLRGSAGSTPAHLI